MGAPLMTYVLPVDYFGAWRRMLRDDKAVGPVVSFRDCRRDPFGFLRLPQGRTRCTYHSLRATRVNRRSKSR